MAMLNNQRVDKKGYFIFKEPHENRTSIYPLWIEVAE